MKRIKWFTITQILVLLLIHCGVAAARTQHPTATATATPTSSSPIVWFLSPVNGQTVSGSITVVLDIPSAPSATNPNSVWWTRLEVDGTPVYYGYNGLPWNTTSVADGTHQLRVDAYSYGSSVSLGSSTISVIVNNSGTTQQPTSTPGTTAQPTPAPSMTPQPTPPPKATQQPTPGPTPDPPPSGGFSISASGNRFD